MFGSMHATDCPMERARLCLPGVRNMYGGSLLHIRGNFRPAHEFLDAMTGSFGQVRGQLVYHAAHDALISSSASREAEWVAYANTVDSRIGDAACLWRRRMRRGSTNSVVFASSRALYGPSGRRLSARRAASPTFRKLSEASVRLRRVHRLARETLPPSRPIW